MINQLKKLDAIERLELYTHYVKNKGQYSKKEREEIENYFKEDG